MQELNKTKEKLRDSEVVVEQKSELPQAPEKLERVAESLEESQEKKETNIEIGEVKIGAIDRNIEEKSNVEIENAREEERLKQEVKDFFRKIILNSEVPERQEIEVGLRRIAVEDEIKFDEVIDESYKLRDDVVKMIKGKKFNTKIIEKIEKWLLLIFPNGKIFCTQAALNLANEVKEHWGL